VRSTRRLPGLPELHTHTRRRSRWWGKTEPDTPRTIRTHLMRLRRKLGEDGENPKYIFAEPRAAITPT